MKTEPTKWITLPDTVLEKSKFLMPWVGYGILIFSLIDFLYILIPPQFTDPVWEFQAIGQYVERIWAPLLGLCFVFYGRTGDVKILEMQVLRLLSWLALLLSVFYLVMIPLGIKNGERLYSRVGREAETQLSQQQQQLGQVKAQVEQATTPEQLGQLAAALAQQRQAPPIEDPQAFKDQLLFQLERAGSDLETQITVQRKTQQRNLLKQAVKWNLGALIAAIWLLIIWWETAWARNFKLS